MKIANNRLQALRVLAVEDDRFQRLALVKVIEKIGIKNIESADNGLAALERLKSTPIDVIICDLNMPEIDGLGLIRRLGEQNFSGSIVLSSAMDSSLIRSAAKMAVDYGLNIVGALQKPFKAAELCQSVLMHFHPRQANNCPIPNVKVSVTDLDNAISQQEIKPVFQPQVCFKTGRIMALEALARWHHPKFGVITPNSFISLAEKNGLIDELTELIYVQSIETLDNSLFIDNKTCLSINISPRSFNDDVIESLLLALKHRTKRKVTIEITEQAYFEQSRVAIEVLSRLRMNGFSLALDDFGTGYSTIEQVSQFPFNELKIDKSFVDQIHTDASSQIIVESCIQLARKLGMSTVVEGVETSEQWHILRQLGADYCQGYFVARPSAIDDLPKSINAWQQKFERLEH